MLNFSLKWSSEWEQVHVNTKIFAKIADYTIWLYF